MILDWNIDWLRCIWDENKYLFFAMSFHQPYKPCLLATSGVASSQQKVPLSHFYFKAHHWHGRTGVHHAHHRSRQCCTSSNDHKGDIWSELMRFQSKNYIFQSSPFFLQDLKFERDHFYRFNLWFWFASTDILNLIFSLSDFFVDWMELKRKYRLLVSWNKNHQSISIHRNLCIRFFFQKPCFTIPDFRKPLISSVWNSSKRRSQLLKTKEQNATRELDRARCRPKISVSSVIVQRWNQNTEWHERNCKRNCNIECQAAMLIATSR